MRQLSIRTARHEHGVRSDAEWAAKQQAFMARSVAAGLSEATELFDVDAPVVAFIHTGCWSAECPCGNGLRVEPEWRIARCFACGAVYRHVVLPTADERLNIEHVLRARPHRQHMNWLPGETCLALALENAQHAVRW